MIRGGLPADFLQCEGDSQRVDLLIAKLLGVRDQLKARPSPTLKSIRTDAHRASARALLVRLWHAMVSLDPSSVSDRRRVMAEALDAATATATILNGKPTPVLPAAKHRVAEMLAVRVSLARSLIQVQLPEARLDDDVLRDVLAVWRTKAKGRPQKVYALARQLGCAPAGPPGRAAESLRAWFARRKSTNA